MNQFDVVVWGATGFTGQLVAEYLLRAYGLQALANSSSASQEASASSTGNTSSERIAGEHPEPLRWAIAGRSKSKLRELQARLGAPVPILVADSDDESSLAEMVAATKVVLTTVGPYAKFGSKLVAACATSGTHYCDLTGEVQWMRKMIDANQDSAVASGARIVHTCGFDSIPSDLGTLFVHNAMRESSNDSCGVIKYRTAEFRGGVSGGTVASMLYMLEEAETDSSLKALLNDPYALNPAGHRRGLDGPDISAPQWDKDFEAYVGPFVMAGVNTRVVRRSNALMDNRYGHNLRYDEGTLMDEGALGFAKGLGMSISTAAMTAASTFRPLRNLLSRFVPQPGEGPDEALRESGYFVIKFFAQGAADKANQVRATVRGDKDPGYGSTSKMIAESAVCLALDKLSVGGGVWTPASAMGELLIKRLHERAGVTFELEER